MISSKNQKTSKKLRHSSGDSRGNQKMHPFRGLKSFIIKSPGPWASPSFWLNYKNQSGLKEGSSCPSNFPLAPPTIQSTFNAF